MPPHQDGDSDIDLAERARYSKKLDGYQAMGLEIDDLRRLLDEDMDEFKATYMGVIRAQLEGGGEGRPEEEQVVEEEVPGEIEVEGPPADTKAEEPLAEEEPSEKVIEEETIEEDEEPSEAEETIEEEVEPSEEIASEEAEEEMELQLEGAGPEEALAATDIPDEEPEEEREEPEEKEEEALEAEEEPSDEEEVQIAVGDEEEGDEEKPPEEEEALIVVATVVEEEGEVGPPEDEMETEVRLSGIKPEDRGEEEAVPEEGDVEPEPAEEPEPVEAPEPEVEPPRPKPVRKVVPKKTVPKEGTAKKPPGKKAPSKGKTPAKKKAPPGKKKAPPPPPKKRPLNRMVIAMFVVALLVIAGSASYFLFLKNEEPIAWFTLDPGSPVVGQVVTFDARNSSDPDDGTIEKYVWSFGDGTSGAGRVVKHSFIEAKVYRVQLTVEDDRGARAKTQRTVEVGALEVSMELPFEGDTFVYDLEGELTLSNYVDGLYEFKGPTGETEYIYAIRAPTVEGEKVFEVTGLRTAKDGFMRDHVNARMERTFYDIDDIRGTIETSTAANPSFTGTVQATVEEDVCQHWERGIRSSVTVNADFKAVFAGQDWATLSTWDEGTFYTQLTDIDETFSLNEFLRDTTFSSEDREKYDLSIGKSTYVWQSRGMERVEGRLVPALHINMTMDGDTLQANNLDNFFIDVWLEPGLSQVAKYHVYVKGQEEGNRFMVDMTEVLDTGTMGTEAASGRPCGIDHTYTIKDDEYPEDFNDLSRVPEEGGTAGGFKISPREAYDEALKDADFLTYVSGHATSFFHFGHYVESGNQGRWVMDFGQKGSSDHREVDAKYNDEWVDEWDVSISDFVDDILPLSSNASIGEVVSLSRGIRLLRAEPEIAALCFDGKDPDWSLYTFNVTEGVSTLSLDPTSLLVGDQETGYVYMLVSRSGPILHRGALDATNGQVLFTWKHSEEFRTFEGFG